MNAELNRIANYIGETLLNSGFIVQRYDAHSTDSIYLKIDYGVCNSIRISDHEGKKYLNYRYNVMIWLEQGYIDNSSKYERLYYSVSEVDKLIGDIHEARSNKMKLYGPAMYQKFMEYNKRDNKDNQGFWKKAKLLKRPKAGKGQGEHQSSVWSTIHIND